ncbi:MAG TPA: Uma2 family endonuclease [Thermoleophilaceae bacterium]|jgi:Uma2 family endonuclease|nr:Uma2 family endonuclease [Thermoleophilaceae bacterium]
MGAPVATRMTAEEYLATSVEGDRTQLIDGRMVVNEPLLEHFLVQGNLFAEVRAWTLAGTARGLALLPVDVVVSEHDVYAPDIGWLREERVPDPIAGRLVGLPDLAVEIRSPSTWRHVVGTKKARYEAAGLPELWLVDTQARSVLVYRRSRPGAERFDVELEHSGDDELSSPLLPGFGVGVQGLFSRP